MKYLLLAFLLTSAIPSISERNPVQSVTTYSGNCILYKKTLVNGNKVKYTPMQEGFGKVVISRSPKRFSFYFDGKLIKTSTDYTSYLDDRQGGEGFTMSGDVYGIYSAHRFTAERTFYVYFSPGIGGMGHEYEIQNYRVN